MHHDPLISRLSLFAAAFALAMEGAAHATTSNYSVNTTSGYVGPSQSGTVVTLQTADTSTSGAATTIDRSTSVTNSVTVYSIGVYSTSAFNGSIKIAKENSSTNYDIVVSKSFSHPGTGWLDVTLDTPYAVPGTGTYRIACFTPAATTYSAKTSQARAITGTADQGVATGVSATTSTGSVCATRYTHTVQPDNMTLVTTTQTADATVGYARCLLEIDPISSITLGTDLTIELTCNGGTNWAAASTYTNCGKGQSGRTVIETDDVACTSGTSVAARIKTLNNKSVNIYKTAVSWH